MLKYFSRLLGLITVLLLLPAQLFAKDASMLVLVADTRKFTGLEGWWANLYNESHLTFALATVVIIPLVGVILGSLADVVMSRLGIDLKHRALAEH
jgi:hypothetical protein